MSNFDAGSFLYNQSNSYINNAFNNTSGLSSQSCIATGNFTVDNSNKSFTKNDYLNGGASFLNSVNYATNLTAKQPCSVATDLITDAYGNLNNSYRERGGTENLIRNAASTVGTTAALCGGPPGAVVGGVIGGSLLASEVFEANAHANIGMNNNITRMYTEKFGDNEVARQMAEDAVWERSIGY